MHLSLNVETGTKAIQLPTNYSLLIHAANEKVGTSKSRIKSTLVRNVSQILEGLSERIPAGLVGAVRSGIDVNKCTKYTRKFFTKTSSFVIFRNNLCMFRRLAESCGHKLADRNLRTQTCGHKNADRNLRTRTCGPKFADRILRTQRKFLKKPNKQI